MVVAFGLRSDPVERCPVGRASLAVVSLSSFGFRQLLTRARALLSPCFTHWHLKFLGDVWLLLSTERSELLQRFAKGPGMRCKSCANANNAFQRSAVDRQNSFRRPVTDANARSRQSNTLCMCETWASFFTPHRLWSFFMMMPLQVIACLVDFRILNNEGALS